MVLRYTSKMVQIVKIKSLKVRVPSLFRGYVHHYDIRAIPAIMCATRILFYLFIYLCA